MDDREREIIVARLAGMPSYLAGMATRLGNHPGTSNPDGEGFSLVEHVWHLADLEEEGYAVRIRRIREEDGPVLADFDGGRLARERQYRLRGIAEGLQAFARARSANLATLRAVSPSEWARRATQEQVGPLILGDIPRMMDEHDASHRQELQELAVESVVGVLRETPARLRSLVAEFSEGALRRPPVTKPKDVEALSPIGHACHLSDIETLGYHARIRKMQTEDRPFLASLPSEQLVVERAYESADREAVLRAFEQARRQTVDTIGRVGPGEWSRTGEFEGYGSVTLLRLIEILAEHDAGHLVALAEMPKD
jgi:DinB superfamily